METRVYKKGYLEVIRTVSLNGATIFYSAYDGEDYKGRFNTLREAVDAALGA